MELHGKQKQMKRINIFYDFCNKKHALLFATDIAARGLDFPTIDWVLQFDCPEDAHTYIHRVGRTARFVATVCFFFFFFLLTLTPFPSCTYVRSYENGGNSMLFVLPSEVKMIELLKQSKVPIKEIKQHFSAKHPEIKISTKIQEIVAEDPELKYLAQKAFISYMRSVFLQANKEVFNVEALPANAFAQSLGLLGSPKIRFGKVSALFSFVVCVGANAHL
jgi:ATP-dependent RNA helicase DDX10/DBP4